MLRKKTKDIRIKGRGKDGYKDKSKDLRIKGRRKNGYIFINLRI